jgi:putative membrane protein
VLLSSYKTVLDAVHERDLLVIGTVGLGAVFGLLSFSRLLKWMFTKYNNLTLALLTGFILGSLKKIWPWKAVLETRTYAEKVIPVREENVWPWKFNGDPQIIYVILLAILGFSLIFVLEKLASKK